MNGAIRYVGLFPKVASLIAFLVLGLNVVSAPPASGPGAQALLQNAERLKLTQRQQSQIRAIIRITAKEFNRIGRDEQGRPDGRAKQAELRKQAQAKALALLTDRQRKLWSSRDGATNDNDRKSLTGADKIAARSLIIPTIEQMKNPPSRGAYGPSAAITATKPHPPLGDKHVILTDHTDPVALRAMNQLARHRGGSVVTLKSLGTLHKSPGEYACALKLLKELKPGFVAIAPRADSYRENMHLCMLRLLSSLDEDAAIDAFPGYLMASNPQRLAELVTRTIQFRPLKREEIRPASIGAIEDVDARRYRSYQKAKVMQKLFATEGTPSPAIIVTTRKSHVQRSDFPELDPTRGNIAMLSNSESHTFDSLSPKAVEALNGNNVLFMFGHGTTDRICGARTSAYAGVDFTDELVFCGSCMSATPYHADRLDLSAKKDNKRFAYHAMDNGAVMMLGHMGLCGGFPKVYPMSELVLEGLSTGEAYQRLMNALIGDKPIPDYYPEPAPRKAARGDAANGLLYILWGDPALTPINGKVRGSK